MIYDSILHTIGNTPVVRIQRLAPKHVTMYVKCEFFNPLASVKDRLAIAIIEDAEQSGKLQAGPDRRRGHFRQYGHCARDGVRGQGLSVRRHDGGDVLGRAPQDHAHARRESDSHAGRRARHRHGEERPKSSRRSTAGSSPGSSRTKRTPPITATPPALKSCGISRASGSTSSSRAGAPAARSRAPGEMIRLARPEVQIVATRTRGRGDALRQAVDAAQDSGLDAGLRSGRARSAKCLIASCP